MGPSCPLLLRERGTHGLAGSLVLIDCVWEHLQALRNSLPEVKPQGGPGSRGKSSKLVGRRNQPESTGNGRNPNTIKTRTSQSQISRDEQSRRIQVQVQ